MQLCLNGEKRNIERETSKFPYFFHVRLSCSEMASKKSSVLRYMPSFTLGRPWMHAAKSFVIFPDSTVSMQAFSSACEKRAKSGLLSNLARCSRPIHRHRYDKWKIHFYFTHLTSSPCKDRSDRIGWCWFSLLVLTIMASDCSVRGFSFDCLAVGAHQNRCHETQWSVSLSNNIWLHVTVVVLAWPHKFSARLQSLCNHIVDQTMFIPNFLVVKLLLVVFLEDFLKNVLEATVEEIKMVKIKYSSIQYLTNPSYFLRMVFLVDM